MKVCGVIVEYNPFHNGHLYHVQQAREKTGADVVIAVMSGNFLQRGEPAILDKWQRANQALQNGIDLVVELPLEWSLQPADFFAQGAIAILQALRCDFLCFGTDAADTFDYQAFGEFVAENQSLIDEEFKKNMDPNKTYPQKMTETLQKLYLGLEISENQPNHVLALSYAQMNAKYPQPMKLFPVARKGAGYHSTELSQTIASATAIRKAVQQGSEIANFVPSQTAADLTKDIITWNDYWPLLRYRVLSSSHQELKNIYQMVDGLEYRIKSLIHDAEDFDDFLIKLKTKRYTRTRLQRLLCYVLLNIRQDMMEEQWQKPYLHVLGFTEAGQQFLAARKDLEWPLFTKIGKKEGTYAAVTLRGDQVYQLGKASINEQNFGRQPLRILK